ncbi:MAG: RecX family transcriptional regulator [Myxococcota bacterium]
MARRVLSSEEALKELALNYVARFPCTTERLRRYLGTKMRDAVKAGEAKGSDVGRWIDGVVQTLLRVKLLDDNAYAELRARTLHLRGRGERFITRDLHHRHAEEGAIGHAIETLDAETPSADLVAAIRLAKKRRLGPFAPEATRAEHRQRHMAAMARSGFSFSIARQVIDARDAEAVDALVE